VEKGHGKDRHVVMQINLEDGTALLLAEGDLSTQQRMTEGLHTRSYMVALVNTFLMVARGLSEHKCDHNPD